MSKRNVHKLSPEPENSFVLLGISSHENDYRLSWSINEHLGFQFAKTENHITFHPKLKAEQEFSTYSFQQDDCRFRLISNRCENGFLLEELRDIDFLLIIEEAGNSFPLREFIPRMKTVPFVSAVFEINPESLKSRYKLK